MPNNPTIAGQAKYFAFLSYAQKDAPAAAALGHYLETFRVPVRLGGREQPLPKRMFPIFRERSEFSSSSSLGAAVHEALAKSGALIVLCSPAAAQSKWVDEEIRAFRRLRDPKRIFPVIVEGEPREAFPPALTEEGAEPLAVDFRPDQDSPRDARLRLAAALLGIDFDALKRREIRRIRSARFRIAVIALAAVCIIAAFPIAVWLRNAAQPSFTEYGVRGTPDGIAAGGDGAIWFTEDNYLTADDANRLGRLVVTRGSGGVTEYTLTGNSLGGRIAAGRDGTLWFANVGHDEIGRVTVAKDGSTTVTEYATPYQARSKNLDSIAVGPDGSLWFTEEKAGDLYWEPVVLMIGHAMIGYDGRVSVAEYPVPGTALTGYGGGISAGPDGALWFTQSAYNEIGMIGRATIGTTGHVTVARYPTPTHDAAPGAITVGPDGALWFTEGPYHETKNTAPSHVSRIGRLVIGRRGNVIITEYPTPTRDASPTDIITGPDGALWFTESTVNQIGRVSIAGGHVTIAEYTTPTLKAEPTDITVGPDGALWFTEGSANRIGRVTTGFRLWTLR